MIRKILASIFIGVAFVVTAPATGVLPDYCSSAEAADVWFYADHGFEYWIKKVTSRSDGNYSVAVTSTHNGEFHQVWSYKLKFEGNESYISNFDRSFGRWSNWSNNDFAQAMGAAVRKYFL